MTYDYTESALDGAVLAVNITRRILFWRIPLLPLGMSQSGE